jgi:integrase/recombinase XerD
MKLLDYLQKQYAPSTVLTYHAAILHYLADNKAAHEYTYAQIIAYIGTLRQRYTNLKTINIKTQSIKAYYKYLCSSFQRKDNPAARIKLRGKISRDIQLQDLFTNEELESLYNAKKERTLKIDIRNKVLISLLIYQGLTPSEIAALQLSDINLEQATIYIQSSLLKNARTLSLNAIQILLFKNYIENIRPLFLRAYAKQICTVHRRIGRSTCTIHCQHNNTCTKLMMSLRGNALSKSDITIHIQTYYQIFKNRIVNCQTIRQSVITNLLKKGHDLRLVQSFSGHKNPSSTERYQQQKVEALQQALNVYHPFK